MDFGATRVLRPVNDNPPALRERPVLSKRDGARKALAAVVTARACSCKSPQVMPYPIPTPAAFFQIDKSPAASGPAVSVVTPMHNEAGGAAALVNEIASSLAGEDIEIIVVDDCSTDETVSVLKGLLPKYPELRVLRHQANAGQSRALRTGILAARGPIIAMLDGDGQNDPADIPRLIATLRAAPDQVAMVAGERRGRQDSAAKKWASKLANGIRRRLLDDGASDTGCGLKAYYREAYLRLPFFDHMHRYLPALMRREGYDVEFVPVSHRPRLHGVSKYNNLGRFLVAIRDLAGVVWLNARARSPQAIEEERE